MSDLPSENLLREIHDLVTACQIDDFSAKQHLRLEQLVCHDPHARRLYVEYMFDSFDLQSRTATAHSPADFATGVPAGALPAADESRNEIQRTTVWLAIRDFASNYITLSLLIAAIVMANIVLSMGLITLDPREVAPGIETPPIEFVAEITNTHNVEFDESSAGNLKFRSLFADDELVINAGMVEVTYFTGTRVVLEGPASYKLQGDNSGYLGLGQLIARCDTPESEGFAIATPRATVVDLGTVFAVKVDDQETVTAHVIEGSVQLQRDDESETLIKDQYATVSGDDVVLDQVDKDVFKRQFARVMEAFETPSQRKVLNINWVGNLPNENASPMFAPGAADGGNVGLWNQLETKGDGHSQGFQRLYFSNRSLAAGLAVEFVTPVNSWSPEPTVDELGLFAGHLNTKPDGTLCKIRIVGVNPVKKYDLYLFAARRSDPLRTKFTVSGITKALAASDETTRLIEGTNYVVFRDATPDAEGGIEITFTGDRAGHFNALQLEEKEE